MPRIAIVYRNRAAGRIEFFATEGVEVVCVDHTAPLDAVYETQGAMTANEFDERLQGEIEKALGAPQ